VASIEAFSYPQTNSNLNDFLLSDESLRIWYLQRPEEWANLPSEDGSREHGLVGKTWRRGAKVLIGKAGSCPWEIPFMEVHFLVRFSVAPGLQGCRWKGICSHLGGKAYRWMHTHVTVKSFQVILGSRQRRRAV
jgi:hypothetical protein